MYFVVLIQRIYFRNTHLFITPMKWCMGNHNIVMCLLYETADDLCATIYQLYTNNCWGWQLWYSHLAALVGPSQLQQNVLKNIHEMWAVRRIFIHWLPCIRLFESLAVSVVNEMRNSFLQASHKSKAQSLYFIIFNSCCIAECMYSFT